MAGIFSKLETLIGSNLHSLLDAAIDLNSVEACKYQVRKIEEASNGVKREAAAARAAVGTAQAAYDGTELEIAQNTSDAELLLSDDDETNDGAAAELIEKNEELEATLAAQLADLESAKQVSEAMATASSKLSTKKTELIKNIGRLEALERTKAAKKSANDALEQVAALSSSASAVSVDDVAARLKREAAVEDERLKENLTNAAGGSAADAVAKAKAAKKVKEMRERIAAKKAGAAA